MALRIGVRNVGPVTILDLTGKLAGEAGETLADRIDDLIETGNTRLILNLRGVAFIDSAALGTLLSRRAAVMKAGGQLRLLNLTERVWDLMVTTKLELVFETFSSEADALEGFASR